jgi:TetR/AcrR family transcriptional regulator, regulator of cefoperazone and chloramphenicol sensitivity
MVDDPIPDWCRALLEPRDDQGKKRLLLLQTAFDVIAEVGFEGLRTRAVATRAGVNIATLHYYFPSKQDLVEGLAQFIGAKFVTVHGPKPTSSGYPALDRLRQEFSDGRHYFKHEPGMLLVMQEFVMRGKRDREVQKVVEQMNCHWQQGIEQMVLQGVRDGTFRADMDAKVIVALLMSIFSGMEAAGGDKVREIERSTESWILSDKVKKQLRKAGETK